MFFRQPSYQEGAQLKLYIDEKFHSEYDLKTSSGIVNLDVDIKSLNVGLHSILAQTSSDDGTLSAPYCTYFFKMPSVSSGGTLNTYIDEKLQDSRQVSADDGLIAIDFDVKSLPIGLHILRAQIKGDDNIWSSSFSKFFLRVPTDEEYQNMMCYYTFFIPDEEGNVTYDYGTFKKGGTYANGGFSFDADVSDLDEGDYHILCALVMPDGTVSSIETASFKRAPTYDYIPSEYPEISNLKAETSMASGVTLTWDGTDEAFEAILDAARAEGFGDSQLPWLAGYRVYRNGANDPLNDGLLTETTYNDTTLDLLEANYYAVTAVYQLADESLHESAMSDTVHATQRLEKPSIRYASRQIYIEGAYPDYTQIYYAVYSSQQSNPDVKVDGTIYQDPFTQSTSGYVYALASLGGYFDSEIVEYSYVVSSVTCVAPTITVDGTTIKLESSTKNAAIYYTLDGTNPTSASTKYINPFTVTENCTIKAIAVTDDYFDSAISTEVIDSFYCSAPTFTVNGAKVTIACETDSAKIYYTLNGTEPTALSALYENPFTVTENCTIKAIAKKTNFNDSEVSTQVIDTFKCETPIISVRNGVATITCETDSVAIHYTIDGTDPTALSDIYSTPIAVSGVCTIKAIAVRANFNNSEVATYNYDENSVTCVPPVITISGNTVTITCDTDIASIYYTLNGDTPTSASTLYEGAFTVSQNCTIKAIAIKTGYFDSDVAQKEVNSFYCAEPEITVYLGTVTITCETDSARIYYTLNGTEPSSASTYYSGSFSVSGSCTIKAIAIKANFNDSDVAICNYDKSAVTCVKPEFTVNSGTVSISTATSEASIYYTTDGTTPTSASTLYEGAFTVSQNCTVMAIAMRESYFDSDVATQVIDTFQCAKPTFKMADEDMVEISCATNGAAIYYNIGSSSDPDMNSTLYSGPFQIADNRMIKAIAYADNFNPSEVATFLPNAVECEAPSISYDGRMAKITAEAGATISYTLDDGATTVYDGAFDIYGAKSIKAWASMENFNDSEVTEYVVPAYFDGETAIVNEAGQLSKGFEWAADELADLAWIRLQGTANNSDFVQLMALTSLGAVIWELEDVDVPDGLFDFNPNLLLYVSSDDLAAKSGVRNVVVNGYAEAIELDESGNFYCPEEFTAYEARYTHAYSMTTAMNGDTQGWETLVLPFDVQTINHLGNSGTVTAKGEIRPFAAFSSTDYSQAKPFWLYSMNGRWQAADQIEAYTPYLISMPNNIEYIDDYILAGTVEFVADNATFPVTQDAESPCGSMRLVGTTMRLGQDDTLAPINRYDDSMGYAEGSAFVPELRDVEPFEAYLTDANGSRLSSPIRLAPLGWNSNSLPADLINDALWRVYSYDGVLYISTSRAQRITIYSLAGQALRILDVQPGLNEVHDLTTGIYIVKDTKVFVEMKHK